MTNSPIHSLHGQYFTAEICFDEVMGRISVSNYGTIYLCQDVIGLTDAETRGCRDFFGHKFVWPAAMNDLASHHVLNLKILPSPIEYHALFREILERRGPTWSEDGSYSVIPNEVLAKIQSFLEGIKEFDVKNLGNNQNQL